MNSDLHFPIPPFQVDRLHIDTSFEEIARYLARVRSWRAAVLGFISRPYTEGLGETEGLTERARKALETFLASEWPKSMKNYAIQSPYNITSFPLSATEVAANSTVESVLEVIRWRAGVVDYLDDVWDVIGDPFLNLDECQALDRFLHPISAKQLCAFCLSELASGLLGPGGHDCLLVAHVRAKWPPIPQAKANETRGFAPISGDAER
jgi:hypothetical protein